MFVKCMKTELVKHPISPVYDENSRILILGSFPSVKSREVGFFYGHPQNRFWKVLAAVLGKEVPVTTEQKKQLLLDNGIALWDVLAQCEITGSSDASIRNVVPNDLSGIFRTADIRKVFVNGKTAEKMYKKYLEKNLGIECVTLPSTSGANAANSLEKLIEKWRVIKDYE